jgi:hypothetical protein
MMRVARGMAAVVVACALGVCQAAFLVAPAAQAPERGSSVERRVWYFYTVKWGKQDRFLDLFQRNHYPLLRAQLGSRLSSIKAFVPTYHGDGRADWTFAVELTFKDTAALTTPWADEEAMTKKLYPDMTKFRAEEQERFEALDAHWDVPLNEINLDTRRMAATK